MPPLRRQPACGLRQPAAQPPDRQRKHTAQQHHPAPAADTQRRVRHKQPGAQRHAGHRQELQEKRERKCGPAHVTRYQFGQVGIDGHQFDAQPDPHHKAQHDHCRGSALQAHGHRGGGVPDQRHGEHQAAAEAIGKGAEQGGPDEQTKKGRRGKRGLIGHAEGAVIAAGKDAVANEPRADIGGLEQVVQLEETAQRQQPDQPPQRGAGGQAVDARGDLRTARRRGSGGGRRRHFRRQVAGRLSIAKPAAALRSAASLPALHVRKGVCARLTCPLAEGCSAALRDFTTAKCTRDAVPHMRTYASRLPFAGHQSAQASPTTPATQYASLPSARPPQTRPPVFTCWDAVIPQPALVPLAMRAAQPHLCPIILPGVIQ